MPLGKIQFRALIYKRGSGGVFSPFFVLSDGHDLTTHSPTVLSMVNARSQALALYRDLLRHGNKFSNYNFRAYALRRSKDAFRNHQNEADPSTIGQLLKQGEQELQVVKRQAAISNLYSTGDRLVVENSVKPRHV